MSLIIKGLYRFAFYYVKLIDKETAIERLKVAGNSEHPIAGVYKMLEKYRTE